MIKNTLKQRLLKTPVVFFFSLFLIQGLVTGQDRSDSLAVFDNAMFKDPVQHLEPLKRYAIQIKPQSMVNPELDLFGPSDLIPTYGQRFIPPSELSVWGAVNHSRDIKGGLKYQNPTGFQFVGFNGNGFWIKEKNYSRQELNGTFLTGNNQLNTGSLQPDLFYTFSGTGVFRAHHPKDSQTDSVTLRLLDGSLKLFSDPVVSGDQWEVTAGYSHFLMDGKTHFETGTINYSGKYSFDFSFLNWISTAEGWKGTGQKRSETGSITAESGFEFTGDQFEIGILAGYFNWSGIYTSESGISGSGYASFHTRQTHQKINWKYVSVRPGFEALASNENWIATRNFAAIELFNRHHIEYNFEWIPTKHWVFNAGTNYHHSEDRIYPDSVGHFSVLTTSSHRVEARLSWFPVFNTRITAGLKKEFFFGAVKSVPFEPGAEGFLEVSWLTQRQKNRVSGRVRYHTERYNDQILNTKLADFSDISLKIEDFHWFTLNFFAEFKIITTGQDQFYPGLYKNESQYFIGLRYNL